jgi:hypothetical protein
VDAEDRIVFIRPDPTEHALLICKLGPQHGNLKETKHFKPPGTEWAQPQDLADAGYVPKAWRELAVALLAYTQYATEHDDGTPWGLVAEYLPIDLREGLRLLVDDRIRGFVEAESCIRRGSLGRAV